MKPIKIMLSGLALIGVAAWCAALDAQSGSFLMAISFIAGALGILVFIIGLLTKNGPYSY